MEYHYQPDHSIRVEPSESGYSITIGDRTYAVQLGRSAPGELTFTVDGQNHHAYVAADGPRRYVAFDSRVQVLTRPDRPGGARRRSGAHHGEESLAAAMPGQVVSILTSKGQSVSRGQTLAILEAMKMEIRVTAPHDGQVLKVLCEVGQIVERGQTLFELGEVTATG